MLGFRGIKRAFSLCLFFDFEMKQLCVFSFFFLFFFLKRYLVDIGTLCALSLSLSCVHSYRRTQHEAVVTKKNYYRNFRSINTYY